MAKTFALVFGAIYVLIGVLGFILPSPLLGIFGVTPLHNIVHLAIGALWLVAATAAPMGLDSARTASAVIGPVYLLVAVFGFVAPGLFDSLLNPDGDASRLYDNLLHLVTGGLATYIGYATPRAAVTA
ncbi:MAG: DUF4383 domain-containing protein [Candidatus Limnocylindria bacterium]